MPDTPTAPNLAMTFEEASDAVLDYLKTAVPLGYWAVTRYDGEDQVYLRVRDDTYGRHAGDRHRWSDSFCQYATTGRAPQIAGDAMAVPVYAAAGVAQRLAIGAYVGIPLHRPDGSLFGTLCGLDPRTRPGELDQHGPLLHLLASLLTAVLQADLERVETARRMEAAELAAETDALTGLLNRRGWQRYIQLEEQRWRRFGDPGSVIVVDLDRLKAVNDSAGHAAGDAYIQTAAAALREAVRRSDVLARLGGDEFGIIAAGSTVAEAEALVDRLRRALSGAGVAGSIGSAPYTFQAGFPGAWEAADAAMYADKRRRSVA